MPIDAFEKPIYVTRPMLGDLAQYLPHFEDIWASGHLTNNGPKHQALEAKMAEVLEAPNAKLFSNGTLALITALKALELKGEVIVTPFTFPATVHALEWCGLTPVFCDIDKNSMCLDPTKIEALVTPQTSAILAVHVYGIPCDVDGIQAVADKHGLKVIYDAAHAFKSTIHGKGIGTYGDMTMFSFHATKLFHTCEGGALTFNDDALAEKINLLKNFGIYDDDDITIAGGNAKMNELQAAVGLVNLGLIEEEYTKRRALRTLYEQRLASVSGVNVVAIPDNVFNSLQYMVVRVDESCALNRDSMHEALKDYNVVTRRYFHPLCSEFGCYSHLPKRDLSVAQHVAQEVLCLPFYGALSLEDAGRICDMIEAVIASAAKPAIAVAN